MKDPGATAAGAEEWAAARRMVLAVGENGLRHLTGVWTDSFASKEPVVRAEAARMIAVFCRETACDFAERLPTIMREILRLYADSDAGVLAAALDAMKAMEERFGKEEVRLNRHFHRLNRHMSV